MAERPTIGVTGPAHRLPWAWIATRLLLLRAGARPVRLHAGIGLPAEPFDGFLIGGGNDIDPGIYGGDVSATRTVDPQRDEYELTVLETADRYALPVLGICRGAQLLNVHAGGSLIGDLKPHRQKTSNRATLLPRKRVDVTEHSTLHRFVSRRRLYVNSLHHQAVDRTGDGLSVVARDRDGIVQAIEGSGELLRLGVQWHPEYLPQRPEQRRLFDRFAAACAPRVRTRRMERVHRTSSESAVDECVIPTRISRRNLPRKYERNDD